MGIRWDTEKQNIYRHWLENRWEIGRSKILWDVSMETPGMRFLAKLGGIKPTTLWGNR